MQTAFELHPIINFESFDNLKLNITELKKQGKKLFWLQDTGNGIPNYISEINSLIKELDLFVLVSSVELVDFGIKAYAIISSTFNQIPILKQKYPLIKIGGMANNFADCKNVELFDGDFLYMGPFESFGSKPYITLSPQKPAYEWRFIDITIPVIAFGECDKETLNNLTQKANLFGFAAPIQCFKKLNSTSYRFTTD